MRTLLLLLGATLVSSAGIFRNVYPRIPQLAPTGDPGQPLFLTPYIQDGKIQEAQQLCSVTGIGAKGVPSCAGFLTVNPQFNSNLYFWYIPAVNDPDNAPVVLWLQGGPGGSSLFGLFMENGPFSVDKSMKLVPRAASWTLTSHMIYIDNPVGTGFSFTENDAGYARNQSDVGRDLYDALVQFFTLFPNLQKNEFYVTGESYAGKYVPAISYKIHTENPTAALKINYKGMAIGDGLCDPISMIGYGSFLYNIGLLDENESRVFRKKENLVKFFVKQGEWQEALEIWNELLNNDLRSSPSYFTNFTGFDNYYNYLYPESPADGSLYGKFIQMTPIRKAIHVGNLTYNDGDAVEEHLLQDMLQSIKPWFQELLEANYKIMLYSGQMDIIVGHTLTQNFIRKLNWSGAKEFQATEKKIWRVGNDIAGYIKQSKNFSFVVVRNSGHMVPFDQPKWAYHMINRFLFDKSKVSQ